MKKFFKQAHYKMIEHYRKQMDSLLDLKFKLASYDVLNLSVKMDVHIHKHIILDIHDNIIIKPVTMSSIKVFKLKTR